MNEKDKMVKRSEKMKPGFRKMEIPVMKARDLRLDRFLRMTDNLDNQPYCPDCRSLANKAENLALHTVQTKEEYQTFEKIYLALFGEINEHLKTSHNYRIPNYFLAFYTLIYMLVGILGGLFVVYLGRVGNFGNWSYEIGGLLGFVIGLIIGQVKGRKKDKQIAAEHKSLY